MGCFQALEVLKIASGQVCILSAPPFHTEPLAVLVLSTRIYCLIIWMNHQRIAERVFIEGMLRMRGMFCACVIK